MALVFAIPAGAFAALPPELAVLSELARSRNLSRDPAWLKLLHYRKTGTDSYRSQASGPLFFLAENGRTDPAAELDADLRAFAATGVYSDEAQHPVCRFPARYKWLQAQLHWETALIPPRFCPRYEEFRSGVDIRGVSLVFSSYYLNNPSSAFGHTFLRLKRRTATHDEERLELLDYGVNYAAVVDTGNPLLYAFKGIFGLFHGNFTRIPYFYKVREYNDYESRDLWEYDLKLTPQEMERLVDHVWEFGAGDFTYLYLTENCSYHMLSLLEAAMPRYDFLDQLPVIVLPAETVRVLAGTPGLVTAIRYRPSLRSTFQARADQLGSAEMAALHETVDQGPSSRLLASLDAPARTRVLDAATDYVDFLHFREMVHNRDSEPARFKQKLMVARAEIPIPSNDLEVEAPQNEIPHTGHAPQRFGLGSGAETGTGGFFLLNYRFALHDLLDPPRGYPETAQIEFFHTQLRYRYQVGTFAIDELTLFQVMSLSPWRSFSTPLTWRVRLGGETVRDNSCPGCFAGIAELGGGLTLQPVDRTPLYLIGTLDTSLAGSPRFAHAIRPGLGPTLALRCALSQTMAVLAEARYRYLWLVSSQSAWGTGLEWRWALHDGWAVDLHAVSDTIGTWISGGAMFYF